MIDLQSAISAAPCLLTEQVNCNALRPVSRHPECAAAAAKAWFSEYLASEEAVERGGKALHDSECDCGYPWRTCMEATHERRATVVLNELKGMSE